MFSASVLLIAWACSQRFNITHMSNTLLETLNLSFLTSKPVLPLTVKC